MTRDKAAHLFSAIVVGAWVITLGFGLVTRDYTELTVLTPILMMVGGYVLGYGPKKDGTDG